MLFTGSNTIKIFLFSLLFSVLVACEQMPVKWNPQDYTVKRGDTLYSIAWRYEMDFRDIAVWNQINAPYAIYPGQRLRMAPDDFDGTTDRTETVIVEDAATTVEVTEMPVEPAPAAATVISRPAQHMVQKGDTLYSISRQYDIPLAHLARWNALHKTHQIKPGQILRLTPPGIAMVQPPPGSAVTTLAPVSVETSRSTPVVVVKQPEISELPSRVEQWIWPAKGRIIKTFNASDTARKGIGIAGNQGQSVVAAASGRVVYSGNGLISYGNLVIIKHSNDFLSAYAYNKRLLVSEGDFVRAGQEIAQMGVLDNDRAELHFEIRKDGKPVDPLRYLPRG